MRLPVLLLLLSGTAALTYQVVWFRWFALIFGVSAESAGTVVAAFFLGLALGSAAAPRALRRHSAASLFLGAELGIGLFGLVMLFVLPRLPPALSGLPPGLPWRVAASFALLVLPTFFMGLSFPAIVGAAVRTTRTGPDLSTLYAANTVGAILGAATCGFWWIPHVGLDGAAAIAVGANFLAALGATRLPGAAARTGGPGPPGRSEAPSRAAPVRAPERSQSRGALLVLSVTGFASIASEVTWTKTLVLLTGGTVYGFTLILAIFLSGLAAGAAVARRMLATTIRPGGVLGVGMLATGAALLLARSLLTWIPTVADATRAVGSPTTSMLLQALFVAGILLPPTFLMGALFPTALTVFAGSRNTAARVGPAYAVNTLASVAGSLAAGLWLIPRLGSDAVLAGCALLVLAAAPLLPGTGRIRIARAAAVGLGVAVVVWAPGLRFEPLIASVRYEFDEGAPGPPEFHFLQEGRTGIVSVVTYGSSRARLQNNGLNESLLDLQDPSFGAPAEVWLGLAPWLLHPAPETAFVAGYGGGVTVRALLDTSLREVQVAELEAATVAAARSVLGEAARLGDTRLRLAIADARHRLLRDRSTFDVIVSQPSHPWRSGASALFTHEFFALVRSRLESDGVFAQWINLFNMDRETLLSLAGTFYDTFPHGFSLAFPETGDLLLLGSPRRMAVPLEQSGRVVPPTAPTGRELLTRFALSRAQWVGLSQGAPRSTDRNLLAEVRLATLRGRALAPDENPYALLEEESTYDLDAVVPKAARTATLEHVAAELLDRGDLPRARRVRHRLAELDGDAAARLDQRLSGGLAAPVRAGP